MIYCILGKFASGKDSILKRLSHHPKLEPVVTMTSRPIRSGEKNGIDYHFVDEKDFFKHKFIEYTQFNGWFYGTPKDSIDLNKDQVIVVNPEGLFSLIDTYGINNIVAFIINRDNKSRVIDYLKRDENSSVEEMIRRYKADEMDFNSVMQIKNNRIYHIQNEDGKFLECVGNIERIIGGYLK